MSVETKLYNKLGLHTSTQNQENQENLEMGFQV